MNAAENRQTVVRGVGDTIAAALDVDGAAADDAVVAVVVVVVAE
jgi:hypothetical protein